MKGAPEFQEFPDHRALATSFPSRLGYYRWPTVTHHKLSKLASLASLPKDIINASVMSAALVGACVPDGLQLYERLVAQRALRNAHSNADPQTSTSLIWPHPIFSKLLLCHTVAFEAGDRPFVKELLTVIVDDALIGSESQARDLVQWYRHATVREIIHGLPEPEPPLAASAALPIPEENVA